MSGKIVHVLCEGQTEQGFVNAVLEPYLMANGIAAVKSVLLTTNRKLNACGGMLSYQQVSNDLMMMRKSSKDGEYERHLFTTMFDLYALPDDFPGYQDAVAIMDKYARIEYLELSFNDDVNDNRFIPYIQLHEFEALVFCGIPYLKNPYPDSDKGCKMLLDALDMQPNPELIDDGRETAPSKRIIKAIEVISDTHYKYNKPKTGKYVTEAVGIDVLRAKCRHFNEWVEKLIQY